jgi:RNA polymerase sigma-70 factor, ECF subfamily
MTIHNKNELVFFESFKKGDEKAFAHFYNTYFNKIQAFSIQFVYSEEEAQNLTQEAFIHLWENKENIASINGIQSFLYTYAKSKCLNYIRHDKVKDRFKNDVLNQKERELDSEILNSFSFDTLEFLELERLINEAVQNLPPKTRTVFIKKRFENKKNNEIAEEMNVTLKSVEAHMTKALKILKTKLSDYMLLLSLFI